MNCWKTINPNKEVGQSRTLFISVLIGVLAFIILYVPFTIYHGTNRNHETGLIPFLICVCFLPSIHSFIHILPLILMNKRVHIYYKFKMKVFPIFTYYTKTHITKKVSLIVLISPTILITFTGIISTYFFAEYYLYLLLFTCIHIGISFLDFWYVNQIIRAPKDAYVQGENDGFDILLKAH
jgi:hypothetical protein